MDTEALPYLIFYLVIFAAVLTYMFSRSLYLKDAIENMISGKPVPIHFDFNARKLSSNHIQYLYRNFEFYKKLPVEKRKVFASRIVKFIQSKNFESRENLLLTYEMKLVIVATAIQITFGLRNYILDSFHTIILYPGEFYSKFSKCMTKGETNGKGLIVFSWKDLKFGFDKDDDALNLAYHELAHAVFLDHFNNRTNDSFSLNYVKWLRFVRDHKKLREVKKSKFSEGMLHLMSKSFLR